MSSVAAPSTPRQVPLFVFQDFDDRFLEDAHAVWFRILRNLDWRSFVPYAVRYYEALWRFNRAQARKRYEREIAPKTLPNPESRRQAEQRLLLERAAFNPDRPAIRDEEPRSFERFHLHPHAIRPGCVPFRMCGRRAKDFFALLKAFIGLMLLETPAEPEFVHKRLMSNPAFARTCGFTLPIPGGYRSTDIPSLRKLQQFDQIMTDNGIWDAIKQMQITENFEKGRLKASPIAVHDTTHHEAWSTRRFPVVEGKSKGDKPLKKAHCKITKKCRCSSWDHCPHEWVNADEGVGTIVKSGRKRYWGHKASTFALVGKVEIPVDAVAVTDASIHDGKTIEGHLVRIRRRHPKVWERVKTLLDDGAADDAKLKKRVKERFGIDLRAPVNPRNRKPIVGELPKGIEKLRPTGVPVCGAGFPFELLGVRKAAERFLFRAPDGADGEPVCRDCSMREGCVRETAERRHVSVPFARLPFLDSSFPQISKRAQRLAGLRAVIERLHKLMKFDYGSGQLTKRGLASYQATLDKTLLAMHIALAYH